MNDAARTIEASMLAVVINCRSGHTDIMIAKCVLVLVVAMCLASSWLQKELQEYIQDDR